MNDVELTITIIGTSGTLIAAIAAALSAFAASKGVKQNERQLKLTDEQVKNSVRPFFVPISYVSNGNRGTIKLKNIGYPSFLIKEVEISSVNYINDTVEKIINTKQSPKINREDKNHEVFVLELDKWTIDFLRKHEFQVTISYKNIHNKLLTDNYKFRYDNGLKIQDIEYEQ